MPSRLAGLCSGASGAVARIASSTWASMRCALVKRSPPCTTRWPMPCSLPPEAPCTSGSSWARAARWSAPGIIRLSCSPPRCQRSTASGWPRRSAMPLRGNCECASLTSANLIDELPQLITRMLRDDMLILPSVCGLPGRTSRRRTLRRCGWRAAPGLPPRGATARAANDADAEYGRRTARRPSGLPRRGENRRCAPRAVRPSAGRFHPEPWLDLPVHQSFAKVPPSC
ncbi:hypothetical protein D9M70_365530 [compost metagenome]